VLSMLKAATPSEVTWTTSYIFNTVMSQAERNICVTC